MPSNGAVVLWDRILPRDTTWKFKQPYKRWCLVSIKSTITMTPILYPKLITRRIKHLCHNWEAIWLLLRDKMRFLSPRLSMDISWGEASHLILTKKIQISFLAMTVKKNALARLAHRFPPVSRYSTRPNHVRMRLFAIGSYQVWGPFLESLDN